MVIAGRIQRYVFLQCVISFALTLGIIALAIILVDVVEETRTIGSRTQVSILTAFHLTTMKTPRLILETLPFATLVGSILTYSQLNRRSEIPAIRASGVSAWRFLGPAMVLSFGIGVLMVTVLDPLATRLNIQFETERDHILNPNEAATGIDDGVWLSQGDLGAGASSPDAQATSSSAQDNPDAQAIISARHVVGRGEALEDVTFYFFAPGPRGKEDREFTHRIDAKRAELKPGFWQLQDTIENRPGGDVVRQASLALPTNLRSDTLLSRFASAETIPFWDLPNFIKTGQNAGMEVEAYILKFHTLLATPFFMLAMSLIGAVVCLRLARSGGLSQLIGAGALAGFVLFFATRLAGGMSASGATPPEAAAWCPPLFALFAVLTLLAHAEDG
ncbi:MAG TPA: LPS export ABC transporter permease LptG [Hyphomonadaceae bacterium]|nr:LPS export ABC transporter permease LptG [Hyphomonadaceae bacterium]